MNSPSPNFKIQVENLIYSFSVALLLNLSIMALENQGKSFTKLFLTCVNGSTISSQMVISAKKFYEEDGFCREDVPEARGGPNKIQPDRVNAVIAHTDAFEKVPCNWCRARPTRLYTFRLSCTNCTRSSVTRRRLSQSLFVPIDAEVECFCPSTPTDQYVTSIYSADRRHVAQSESWRRGAVVWALETKQSNLCVVSVILIVVKIFLF